MNAHTHHVRSEIERRTCTAPDGVTIVYSAAGSGSIGLVFIHGGLANRRFWDGELQRFAAGYCVLAPDLAGHGESGSNRQAWGMAEFGADVRAVVEAERLERIILFGNSLGGPVAIEAALQLPGRVLGIVGVDTFHRLDYTLPSEAARQRAESFRDDYHGNLKQMVKALFPSDADPALMADAEQRMTRTSPEVAYQMFLGMGGYDLAAAAQRLKVPLRAINGDLYPTEVQAIRKIRPEFEVALMNHMGHYPMLERPEEFDRLVTATIQSLVR